MTLTEFLLARIVEDEARAERAGRSRIRAAVHDNLGCYADDVVFVAHHGPSRVLAECEAKRRVVEAVRSHREGEWEDDPIHDHVLTALALPYADHPDYDESWRP